MPKRWITPLPPAAPIPITMFRLLTNGGHIASRQYSKTSFGIPSYTVECNSACSVCFPMQNQISPSPSPSPSPSLPPSLPPSLSLSLFLSLCPHLSHSQLLVDHLTPPCSPSPGPEDLCSDQSRSTLYWYCLCNNKHRHQSTFCAAAAMSIDVAG